MGVIAEICSDDKGLVWPASVAPFDVHIVPIARSTDDEAFTAAMDLMRELEAAGKRVLLDDRTDASVGFKLADADLIGIPVRVVLSPKTLAEGQVELSYRATGETKMVGKEELMQVMSA